MTMCLSLVVVVFGIIGGSSVFVKTIHAMNLFVLFVTILCTVIYGRKYSKKDLLRTDEEEIEA